MKLSKPAVTLLWSFLVLMLSVPVVAAPIQWHRDVRTAVRAAAATKKPLLIEVATDWCHYCQKMERETFQDQAVVSKVQECFVPLRVDADAQKDLAKQLGVRSFPTIIILSPEMKLLSNVAGYRSATQLGATLSEICQHDHRADTVAENSRASQLKKPSVYSTLCPVTSVTTGRARPGDPRFSIRYRDYDLLFASAEARETFRSNPDSFWPVDDGFCRVSAVEQRLSAKGSWSHAVTWSGRIWLFASAEHMQRFVVAPERYTQPRRLAASQPVPAR